jgi:hypothetical protein
MPRPGRRATVAITLGLLRILRARLADSGRALLETYVINGDDGSRQLVAAGYYAPPRTVPGLGSVAVNQPPANRFGDVIAIRECAVDVAVAEHWAAHL